MRIAGRVAMLVALWLLAWGQLSLANVISGVAVSAALLVAFPVGRRTGDRLRFSPAGFGRLVLYLHKQLLISNLVMARQILRPRPAVRPGVLAHRLREPSEEVVTVMTNVIALSPGTMTVDVDPDSSTIYVHFFLLRDVDGARASLSHLEDLAVRALTGSAPTKESP